MYPASNAFHQAIANHNPQMPLLIFEHAVFTASDINIDKGIEFSDYFNMEEDLSIGQALSNELMFSIFNDHGYLNDFEFGDFTALLGVQLSSSTSTHSGCTIFVSTGVNDYTAHTSSPYLKRNGTAMATQPSGEVANILIYSGYVYVIQKNGAYKVYRDVDGSTVNVTLSTFMINKFKKPTMYGAYYNTANRTLNIYCNNILDTYEFVPLGKFIAERPNVPEVNEIDFSCMDFMQKFEKDMPDNATLGVNFPATIWQLFSALCSYVGVQIGVNSFTNSTATISKRPDQFDNATMRDVLKWIAEAAGGNMKFDRDGRIIIDWIRSTSQTFGPGDYKTFNPYWYETTTVTKLENRSSDGGYDKFHGSGTETYLIQDNPLLRGVE